MNLTDIPALPRTNHVEEQVKYEYEFSCSVDGRCSFIYLVDTGDVSACERVTHRPIHSGDISYSTTGNGFVTDCYGLKLTFTKQAYEPSWETHADIKAGVEYEKKQTRGAAPSAADILASL